MFLGGDTALAEAFVQIQGSSALSMSAADFRREINRHGAFFDLISRYSQAFLSLTMQSTACNSLHSAEERCSRWLLMTQDRVESNELTSRMIFGLYGASDDHRQFELGILEKGGVFTTARRKLSSIERMEDASLNV